MPTEKPVANRFLREKLLLDNLKAGKEFRLKPDLQIRALSVKHKYVWLVYQPTLNLFVFVSGNSFSEARKRLQESDPIWNDLKTFLSCWPVGILDTLKILDTESLDSEKHFISPSRRT